MKNQITLMSGLALCLAISSGAATPAHELTWGPAAGAKLQRVVETKHVLTAELMRTTVNGAESLSQRLFDIKTQQVLTVTDEMRKREGGRPTEFRRYFDATSFEVVSEQSIGRQQTKDKIFKGQGSVVGQSVLFTWIPEDNEYGRYYDGSEGVEEVLPELLEDLSMRTLLPPGPVEVGDSWELDPSVLGQVFSTGGDTNYELEGDVGYSLVRTMRLGMGLYMDSVFGAQGEGKVTAMFTGVEEVDGRKLALIYLTYDVKVTRDMTERAAGGMSIRELGSGFRVDSATVTLSLEGTGMVRWDMQAGHLHDTRDIRGSERVGTKIVQIRNRGDEQDSKTQELIMVGVVKHSSVCTPVE